MTRERGKLVRFRVRIFALTGVLILFAAAIRLTQLSSPEFLKAVEAEFSSIAGGVAKFLPDRLFREQAVLTDTSGDGALAGQLSRFFAFRGSVSASDDLLLTGSTAEAPAQDPKNAESTPAVAKIGEAASDAGLGSQEPTEKVILQKLGERRESLDKREEELNNREALLKASELRLTQRIAELKTLEADLKVKIESQNDKLVSFKPLVTMYEAMKPKDAAQVFENLEYATLIDLVAAMNPRKVSDVVAVMEPKLASRMTKDLATRGRASVTVPDNSESALDRAAELPDISKSNP